MPQVIDIINTLRFDDIEQEIAFKKIENGDLETLEDRQGSMNIIYALYDKKPHSRSNFEEKKLI